MVQESETVTRTSQSSYPSSYQTYDDADSAEMTQPNVFVTSSSLASNSGAFSSSSSIASEVSCSRSNQAGFHPSLVVTIDSSSDSEDNYCDQIDGTEKVVVDLDEDHHHQTVMEMIILMNILLLTVLRIIASLYP